MKNILKQLKEHVWLFIFTLLYLVPFTVKFIGSGNGEFIWYALIVIILFLVVVITLPISGLRSWHLWGLSLWALFHLAGGGIHINNSGRVLYDAVVAPIYNGGGEMIILKYDQLIHAFGFGLCTLIVFNFLKKYFSKFGPKGEKRAYSFGVLFIAMLCGMGIGVINEIAEFIAFILFPNNGVGGYVNTCLDLVFNTIGSLIAVLGIHWFRKK